MRLRVRIVGVSDLVVDAVGHLPCNLFTRGAAHAVRVATAVLTVGTCRSTRCWRTSTRRCATLLKDELERHGFEGVDIAFDAPRATGPASSPSPTVNLFLYDLREAESLRAGVDVARRARQRAHDRAPPADGHGVLLRRHRVDAGRRGRAPAALAGARDPLRLPAAARRTRSTAASQRLPAVADQGPRSGRARARSRTSGARSAASTRCRWTTSCGSRSSPALTRERGPEVRTQTVRTRLDGRPAAHGARDAPLRRASCATRRASRSPTSWVTLPDVGQLDRRATPTGRFRFDRLPPGRHRLLARTARRPRRPTRTLDVPGAASTW